MKEERDGKRIASWEGVQKSECLVTCQDEKMGLWAVDKSKHQNIITASQWTQQVSRKNKTFLYSIPSKFERKHKHIFIISQNEMNHYLRVRHTIE